MSIAVELDELRAKVGEFDTDPFLLTVSDDGRPHSVAVSARWDGDTLVVPAGRTSRANARACSLVALLWPPPQRGAFSLIVDGNVARVDDDA